MVIFSVRAQTVIIQFQLANGNDANWSYLCSFHDALLIFEREVREKTREYCMVENTKEVRLPDVCEKVFSTSFIPQPGENNTIH